MLLVLCTFQCKSDSIIGFYGAFFKENNIYMCTEYMDGMEINFYLFTLNILGLSWLLYLSFFILVE